MSEDKNYPVPNEQPAEPKKTKVPAPKKNTVPAFNTKNNRSLSSKFGSSSAKGTAHKGGGMKKGK